MERKKKKILVVDDVDFDRSVASRYLLSVGFDVQEAEGGMQALEICTFQAPDCVFLDWEMEGMNGIEVLQMLRKLSSMSNVPVIFCTGHEHPSYIGHAYVKGANDYIVKPITIQKITEKLAKFNLLSE
jgi:CheY-like chemotaxis protein